MTDSFVLSECPMHGFYAGHLGACPVCGQLVENRKVIKQTISDRPKASNLEQAFVDAWANTGLAMPEREYRFHPTRRWRFDFAFPKQKLALELQGGGFVYGRHHRPQGYTADCEKLNAAIELGWRVLQYTAIDETAIEQIIRCLNS